MSKALNTITYKGQQYIRVEAVVSDLDALRSYAKSLHDLAQMVNPERGESEASKGLAGINTALLNMARSNNLLLDYEAILPKSVPANSNSVLKHVSNASDSVGHMASQLKGLSERLSRWALRVDDHIRDASIERDSDRGTQLKNKEDSNQFSHLW